MHCASLKFSFNESWIRQIVYKYSSRYVHFTDTDQKIARTLYCIGKHLRSITLNVCDQHLFDMSASSD